jgi:hypothetical protein
MASGLTAGLTVAGLNQSFGAILLNLVTSLDQINEMNTFLAATGSAGLQTIGFSSGDAATIISAWGDAYKLYQIFHAGTSGGSPTVTVGYDFTTFIKLLTGTGVH